MKNLLWLLFFAVSQAAAAGSLRVSPEVLLNELENKDLVILDARPAEEYKAGHIRGAVNLPEALTYKQKSASGRIVEPETMQGLLRERGLDLKSQVVVYDAGNLLDAARLFWVLEVYGLRNVKILSPGYDHWVNKAYPISLDTPSTSTSQYVPTIDHQRIASKFATQLATADKQQLIVDVRSARAYRGETSSAKRHGHIPTAINIPISNNIREDNGVTSLRSIEEIQTAYASVPKDKKVVLYCEIGRISSSTYLVLRELGYDVTNYDASWREWGNDLSLPIEK